jgi:hypothetical protein
MTHAVRQLKKFEMKVTPFWYDRLYGDEKYSLNNMLLKMANFPAGCDQAAGDEVFEVYLDRVMSEADAAWSLLKSNMSGDAFLNGATNESFLAFTGKLFALVANQQRFAARTKDLYHGFQLLPARWAPEGDLWEAAVAKATQEIESLPITGAIAVRFTNAGGSPVIFISAIIQKGRQPTYSGNYAPFIPQPRPSFSGMEEMDEEEMYRTRWGY